MRETARARPGMVRRRDGQVRQAPNLGWRDAPVGTVLAQAFSHRLVDEVCFYLAPILCGTGRPVIDPAFFSGQSIALDRVQWKALGDNLRLTGRVRD